MNAFINTWFVQKALVKALDIPDEQNFKNLFNPRQDDTVIMPSQYMVADALATRGAKASTAIALAYFSRNIPV